MRIYLLIKKCSQHSVNLVLIESLFIYNIIKHSDSDATVLGTSHYLSVGGGAKI